MTRMTSFDACAIVEGFDGRLRVPRQRRLRIRLRPLRPSRLPRLCSIRTRLVQPSAMSSTIKPRPLRSTTRPSTARSNSAAFAAG